MSFVLVVYRGLLLRGWLIRRWIVREWLMESTTGFAFFRRRPRLPSPGFPVATVEDEHHRPQLQLAGEAPGIIQLIRRLEARDLLPDIQLGLPTLLRSQAVQEDANIASSAPT